MRLFVTATLVFVFLWGSAVNAQETHKKAPILPSQGALKGKPVLVDFWASWCGPCRESFPWMNEIREKYPDLEIIAINLDEERSEADSFLANNVTNFTVHFDPEGEYAEKFGVPGMPSSYLIDGEGNIIKEHIGFFSSKTDYYESAIIELLAATE